jgi:hypothetical protein
MSSSNLQGDRSLISIRTFIYSQNRATSSKPQSITLQMQLSFAFQTALGMADLARQRIVHRNLAA